MTAVGSGPASAASAAAPRNEWLSLPSGRKVFVTRTSDPRRPWEELEHQGHWFVRRAARGDSSRHETFADRNRNDVLLSRDDARTLASVLNAQRSPKLRHPPHAAG